MTWRRPVSACAWACTAPFLLQVPRLLPGSKGDPHGWGWHGAVLGPRQLGWCMAHTCVRSPGRCPMPPSVIPMSVNMRVPGVLRILSLRAALRHRKTAEVWPSLSVAHRTLTAMLCTAGDCMQDSKSDRHQHTAPDTAGAVSTARRKCAADSCKDSLGCLQHSKGLISGEPSLALQVDGANLHQHLHLQPESHCGSMPLNEESLPGITETVTGLCQVRASVAGMADCSCCQSWRLHMQCNAPLPDHTSSMLCSQSAKGQQ